MDNPNNRRLAPTQTAEATPPDDKTVTFENTQESLAYYDDFDGYNQPSYNEFDEVACDGAEEDWYPSYVHWNGCLSDQSPPKDTPPSP